METLNLGLTGCSEEDIYDFCLELRLSHHIFRALVANRISLYNLRCIRSELWNPTRSKFNAAIHNGCDYETYKFFVENNVSAYTIMSMYNPSMSKGICRHFLYKDFMKYCLRNNIKLDVGKISYTDFVHKYVGGVYRIGCTKSHRGYYGATQSFFKRIGQHITQLNKPEQMSKANKYLLNEYNRFGKNQFRFNVVKYIYPYDVTVAKTIEKKQIEHSHSSYNIIHNRDTQVG